MAGFRHGLFQVGILCQPASNIRTDDSFCQNSMSLLRQSRNYVAVGLFLLLVDWLVFVLLTALGVPAAPGNVAGRVSGALLSFWLNGRFTFQARLGWKHFAKFLLVWLPLTTISTLLVSATASELGLHWAWLAKPLVEGAMAVVSFFLWRHLVYR
jgi:putative flippase GtrA